MRWKLGSGPPCFVGILLLLIKMRDFKDLPKKVLSLCVMRKRFIPPTPLFLIPRRTAAWPKTVADFFSIECEDINLTPLPSSVWLRDHGFSFPFFSSSSTRTVWPTRINDKHFYVYSAGTWPEERVAEDFAATLRNKGQCHQPASRVKPIGQHQMVMRHPRRPRGLSFTVFIHITRP